MRLRSLLAMAAAVLALVFVAYALLDSDDSDPASSGDSTELAEQRSDNPSSTAADGSAPAEPAPEFDSPDEQAGAETVEEVYGGLDEAIRAGIVPLEHNIEEALDKAQDVEGLAQICDLMSTNARDETVEYVRKTANREEIDWTCEKAVALLVRRVKVNNGLRRVQQAEVVAMNVKGNRATATLSFGKGQPLSTVSLVKEDGEWKLGSPPGASK